jgi:16S rRNA (guanine(966)-N(2))-methyltransferase RsmD
MRGLRIIAGSRKGRRIEHPGVSAVRPTKDRVREAVFSMINFELPSARVLDLFAGSGAYGLEALSRGAEKAFFVENDPACLETVRRNIHQLGLSTSAELVPGDAFSRIEGFGARKDTFDIIFADPPYRGNAARNTLIMINRYDILKHSGLLVLEHSGREPVPEGAGDISILKQKTYGKTTISIYNVK